LYSLKQNNIIHRDIKLENIKLTIDELTKTNIRFSGFGISIFEGEILLLQGSLGKINN